MIPDDDENAGERIPFKRQRMRRDMADKFKDMADKPKYKGDEPELPKKAGKKASKKAGQKRTPSKKRAPKAQEVDVAANGEFGWTAPPPMPQEPLSPEDEARRELFEAERWRTEEAEAEEEQRQRQRTLDEMEDRDIVSRRKQQTERAPREFARRMDRIWEMSQKAFKGNEVELTAVRAEIEALKASAPTAGSPPEQDALSERTDRLWSLERRVLERARGYGPGSEEEPEKEDAP